MVDIFSDDDDFDDFRERLFDGKQEGKDEEFVPMFGLYSLQRSASSKPKPREDIFLRPLEAPSSNDLDPYKDIIFEHKKPELEADKFCANFSFFGMNQNRFRMEAPGPSREEQIAERNKLLERARRMREEKEEQENKEEQNYSEEEEQENLPKTPKSIPNKKKQVDTPRPVPRKRTRRIVVSSDEEDSDSEVEFSAPAARSPRKKKVSPDLS